MTIILR